MQGVWSKSILAGALRRQTDSFAENTLRGERYDLRNPPLEQSRLHAPRVNNPGLTGPAGVAGCSCSGPEHKAGASGWALNRFILDIDFLQGRLSSFRCAGTLLLMRTG